MLAKKIKITNELIELIVRARKEHNLTAYQLSEKVGKNKSWLPNIENKRTKNISKEDLFLLLKDFAEEKNMDAEEYLIRHLPASASIEMEEGSIVPNSYLQMSTRKLPTKFDYGITSYEELKRFSDYSKSDKPYEVDYYVFKENMDSLFNTLLLEFKQANSSEQRVALTDMIRTMQRNFSSNFEYSQMLYTTPVHCTNMRSYNDEIKTNLTKEVTKLYSNFLISFKCSYVKARIMAYFIEQPNMFYNLFVNLKSASTEMDQESIYFLMLSLSGYLYELNEYIDLLQQNNNIDINSFDDLAFILKQTVQGLESFIKNFNLKCNINLKMPQKPYSLDEFKLICKKLNNIYIEIKDELQIKII